MNEIIAQWNWWRECVMRLKVCPTSMACQYMAMMAQKELVIRQAIYFAEVKA